MVGCGGPVSPQECGETSGCLFGIPEGVEVMAALGILLGASWREVVFLSVRSVLSPTPIPPGDVHAPISQKGT